MAQYDRPPKVKAKGPDEFVSTMDRLVRYFLMHQNKFYLLVAAGLLALAGLGIYRTYVSKKLASVAVEYTAAEKAPATDALSLWQKVLQKHPPRGVGHLAQFQIGGIEAGQGRWAQAAQAFQQGASSREKVLSSVGGIAEAVSLENAKDCPKAAAIYERISREEKNPFRFDAQLGMARCYLVSNRANDAETILFELISTKSVATPAVKSAALNELIALKL